MMTAKPTVYEAARDGNFIELCDCLIRMSISERRTALESKIQDGDHFVTPLIIAAYNGNLNAVKILLRYKADIEALGSIKIDGKVIEGCTPLWAASLAGHLDVVKLLIERNAEVDCRTSTNSTPLRSAAFRGHLDIVRFLVENGADINVRNDGDNTPLMVACYRGHAAVVSYLIAHGARLNLQGECGYSALHCAVEKDHFEIVDDLMALGASQLPNNGRLTPLLLASNCCKIEMVENLIKSPKCTKEQRIEALELLGGTIANESKVYDIKKAFSYMKRGMEERFQESSHPLLKKCMEPLEAYDCRKESQSLKELEEIEGNDHAIHMEGLIIRERILGTENMELCYPIRYRGAVFADSGNYDLCIGLWLHAMDISHQCSSEEVTEYLGLFCNVFCDMVEKNCPPRQKHIEEVFERVIGAYQMLIEKLQSGNLEDKDETKSLRENLETVIYNALHLTYIFVKVRDIRKKESSGVFGLIQRFLSLNPRTQNGDTLLHLSVWYKTPTDERFVSKVCKYPCAKTTKVIINAGGNVNAVNNEGNTPLHLAVAFKSSAGDLQALRDVLEALLDAGANKELVNKDGKTALEVAEADESCRILTVKN